MHSFFTTFLVAALGYFVDIYDLLLFGVVRVESLRAIGIESDGLLDAGMWLINCQMAGMLLGGIFWGVLGDKKGRTTVMMASILLYSIANIANGFVSSLEVYAVLRFIAGFGLSGEVGAAVTLVSEAANPKHRTLWTTLLTAFGLLGAVTASLVGDLFHWQMAYWIGGGMGLALMFLRFRVLESSIFEHSPNQGRGKISLFFKTPERFLRYVACVLIGVPIWYSVGILMTFSPELTKALGSHELISAGRAIMFCYAGLAVGDVLSGLLSHWIKTRRGVIGAFMILHTLLVAMYLNSHYLSPAEFYTLCFLLGLAGGYWSVYVTTVAESFGTNIRATAVITVTNCMRASVVLMTSGVQALQRSWTLHQSAFIMGSIVLIAGALSLVYLKETFGKELDYQEC